MRLSVRPEAEDEQRILRQSIGATIAVALLGIVLGLISSSQSIVFDGVSTGIEGVTSVMALVVARLVGREARDRQFQFGYWHLEPAVLAINGGTLMLICLYGFLNGIDSVMEGGRLLQFDLAIGYSVVSAVICVAMWIYQLRANRRIGSEFIRQDAQSWAMSALTSLALLAAFAVAWLLEGTRWSYLTPYADPGMLLLLSIIFVFVPIGIVRTAWRDMLLITPQDLDDRVRQVMSAVIAQHGFKSYSSYAVRQGRKQFIAISIVVPADVRLETVGAMDALRGEIARAIDPESGRSWLMISFTADPQWL